MTTVDIFRIKNILSVNEPQDERSNRIRHVILNAKEEDITNYAKHTKVFHD
jgi:hypothetical protein